jgi:monoamine oxidase
LFSLLQGQALSYLVVHHARAIDGPVGWTAGPNVGDLAFYSREFVLEQALASLGGKLRIASEELKGLVLSWHFHDWQSDPYACGAYSYALAGGSGGFRELAKPIGRSLFFAGEATDADGYNGTVHGAMASGERVADEVLESIRKSNRSVA